MDLEPRKCPINNCTKPWDQVSDRAFVCKYHWKKLPNHLMNEVFAAERIGGKTLKKVQTACVQWLREWDAGSREDLRPDDQKVRNRHTRRKANHQP